MDPMPCVMPRRGHVQVKRPEMEYSYDDKIRPAQKAEMESGVGEIEIQFGTGTKKVKAEGKEELTLTSRSYPTRSGSTRHTRITGKSKNIPECLCRRI